MKNKLKDFRTKYNFTQKDVAEKLNITRSSYSVWESGLEIIPLKHLNDFCNYFNISLDFYFDLCNTQNYNITKKDINMELSSVRLKEFRKEMKITQDKLSKILNTSQSVIAGYETKKNLIATPFLYEICKKYKISADYLLGKIDNPKYLN